ncbi:MAG: UDP-N-acetylglucosamine--N-acetylmuramyl-(pentapeptide) pyrophosphoryl-undecaprenol N-acetylglucosamine transferase [Leptospira sp.]|nr:UDP-N-acetylglucosamine--N-acetylmuramyl-(pentapeptide) pyrophosphoryl-undecaprenol N-acetylglucosamine transferase [Leptospira sp.]NCS93547.1 UDP-N-acetylglucosamine--N-acetylmuramyl-(pentapeptide) pyrophosphoryl-undecaprenol N-acetylglucosamine transferase [Leptospira sp.]
MRTILIAAGGTGGHISPGIALLEQLTRSKENYDLATVYLHCPLRNKNYPDLKDSDFKIIWHNLPQFKISNSIIYPFLFLIQFIKASLNFNRNNITTVIGMGGYTSVLALLYAVIFRKELFLCEQNCIPGKITRIFWNFAKKIALSFPIENNTNTKVKTAILGNPVRSAVIPKTPGIKNQKFSDKNMMNVLVLGGSQGARQINEMVIGAMSDSFINKHIKFRVLTGANLYNEFQKSSSAVEAISYSKDMGSHYEWADLVVARSGAGVLAECSVFSLPMILIPYPYAKDNHQMANAKYFESQGACILIDSKSSESNLLIDHLKSLYQEDGKLLQMSIASLQASKINSSSDTLNFFFHGNE